MPAPVVLVVAPEEDVHARTVAYEARDLDVEILSVDLARFPHEAALSVAYDGSEILLRLGGRALPASALAGAWIRRPSAPRVDPAVQQEDAVHFARASTRATFLGGLGGACANVVNPVGSSQRANLKPLQLAHAHAAGLRVPATLVSNDPDAIRAFARAHPQACYKTVSTWRYDLKETRRLDAETVADTRGLSICPTIFQAYVDGGVDLRVTVVDGAIFAAAQHVGEGRSPVDGRLDRVRITPATLDEGTQAGIRRYMAAMGLRYGAFDFRVDRDGAPWFLECNPEGQYLWIEIETGLPISRAIALALAGRDPREAG
ncbi:hypothetical protein ACTZWW_14580 [Salinarimonas sp. NSM]|uniref:hypothetical protein n=1 Tax=Salinarimonas sp. NSM TaxID=3458003 RepID=UPI0040353916